jgi:hypothetical protein
MATLPFPFVIGDQAGPSPTSSALPGIRAINSLGIINSLSVTSTDPTFLGGAAFSLTPGIKNSNSMTTDALGNLYVGDTQKGVVWKITPGLVVTCVAGMLRSGLTLPTLVGGPALAAVFGVITSIVLDAAGNLYIQDSESFLIWAVNMQATTQTLLGVVIAPGFIQIVAGQPNLLGSLDGSTSTAKINGAGQMAFDPAGNLYTTDTFSLSSLGGLLNASVIRRIDHATGNVTTPVGTRTGTAPAGFTGDGGPASNAVLNGPNAVAFDPAGNLYFWDAGNFRIRAVAMGASTTIWGVNVGSGSIQTVAGTGANGHTGDGGLAVFAKLSLDAPSGVDATTFKFDPAGNCYIYSAAAIRMITPAGIITTIVDTAVTSGSAGDGGPATAATIALEGGLAFFSVILIPPTLSERSFATNGCFESTSAYGDVLKSLALSMAGFVVPPGDCWRVYAGSYVPPEVSLADNDCRASIKGDFRLSSRDTCNGVKGQYIPGFLPINPLGPLAASPASPAWKKTDFPPVQRANYIAEDGGIILWKDIQLDFTISLWMAQRIARIVLERLRRQMTVSLPAKLSALALLAADTMNFNHPRWATVTPPVPEVFQIAHTALRMESQADGVPAFGVDMTLRQTDADVFEFAPPTSPTAFGDYSPYGQTGIGAGNVE